MNKSELAGVARTLLSAAGGFIVAKGWIDAETMSAVAGALATLFVAAWSIKAKRKGGGA